MGIWRATPAEIIVGATYTARPTHTRTRRVPRRVGQNQGQAAEHGAERERERERETEGEKGTGYKRQGGPKYKPRAISGGNGRETYSTPVHAARGRNHPCAHHRKHTSTTRALADKTRTQKKRKGQEEVKQNPRRRVAPRKHRERANGLQHGAPRSTTAPREREGPTPTLSYKHVPQYFLRRDWFLFTLSTKATRSVGQSRLYTPSIAAICRKKHPEAPARRARYTA